MTGRLKRTAPVLDVHGEPIDPAALYECTGGYVAETAPGMFISAATGSTFRGDTPEVQRSPQNFKRHGTSSPPAPMRGARLS